MDPRHEQLLAMDPDIIPPEDFMMADPPGIEYGENSFVDFQSEQLLPIAQDNIMYDGLVDPDTVNFAQHEAFAPQE